MKRSYIKPQVKYSGYKVETILHQYSGARIKSNTVDFFSADEEMGVDNNASSVEMSSKQRGNFYEGY